MVAPPFRRRTRGLAFLLGAGVVLAGCGGGQESPEPGGETPPVDTAPDGGSAADVSLVSPIRNDAPMPPAEEAGGIPPYPNAVVHVRVPRDSPGIESFEAFSPDDWTVVEAFYDSTLAGWKKTRAEETVVYEKGNDEAAVTVSPWDFDQLPIGAPETLRRARTAIGAAWRP